MNPNMHQFAGQLKILGTVAVTHVAGSQLENVNQIASIFAYVCGGLASLAIAYYHLRKKK